MEYKVCPQCFARYKESKYDLSDMFCLECGDEGGMIELVDIDEIFSMFPYTKLELVLKYYTTNQVFTPEYQKKFLLRIKTIMRLEKMLDKTAV